MNTIGEIIEKRKKIGFTNRYNEVNLFTYLISESKPEFNALNIYGVGGIGKSSLLNKFESLCREQGIPHVRIRNSDTQTIVKLVRNIRKQLSGNKWWGPFRKFDQDLKRYLEIQSRIEKSQILQQAPKVISSLGSSLDPTGLYNKLGKESVESGLSIIFSILSKPDIDFYIQADRLLAERLVEALGKTNSSKLVIMMDEYEQYSPDVKKWIEQDFAPTLKECSILVLSGRQRLMGEWVNWEANGVLRQIELLNFNKSTTREMLVKAGISEEGIIEEIFEFTQGHPLCVALVTEMGISLDKKFLVIDTLVERVLSQLTDEKIKSLLITCTIPRFFNQDIVNLLSKRIGIDSQDISILKNYSFIHSVEYGFVIHDVVRDYLLRILKQRSPEDFIKLNEVALEYFQKKQEITQPSSPEYLEYTSQAIYHQLVISERKGVNYCLELFTQADIMLDLQLAISIIGELEKVQTKDQTLKQWPKILKARYEYLSRNYEEAVKNYNDLLVSVDDPEKKFILLQGLSSTYAELNRLDESLFYGEKALYLADNTKNLNASLDILYTLGKVLQRQGRVKEGIDLLESRISSKSANDFRSALLFERLGLLYLTAGQLPEAQNYYQLAILFWEEARNEWKIAIAQHGLAGILCKQEKWYEAIQLLEKALETSEKIGDQKAVASCLSKLARAKIGVGDSAYAILLAEESISIYRDIGDLYGWALTQNVLALAFREQREYQKAIDCYQKSLKVAKDGGNKDRELATLLNIARIYNELNDRIKSLKFSEKALDIALSLGASDQIQLINDLITHLKS